MLFQIVLATLLTSAPADDRLVGSWTLNGAVVFELAAGGRGRVDGDAIRWKAANGVLTVTDEEGEAEQIPYELRGDQLVINMGGMALALVKSGIAARAPSQEPSKPVQAEANNNSELARLLLSSAWCSFSYKSGTTRTSRAQFYADGTWGNNANRETQWSGANGSYYGQNGSGAAGQWKVQGETLLMSMPPEYPSLTPVPYSVTRNSNGYPILTVAGTEYSMCN